MTKLSVNVNAVAHLRNRRSFSWPSVTGISRVVLDAGADGITVHPRPDERHIRRSDVFELAGMLRADYPAAEFNIEGYPSPDFLRLVEQAHPDQVTFVPDDPVQATSDHGWDIPANRELLSRATGLMKSLGVRVSLFIDADPAAPAHAAELGADRVELYTGPYALEHGTPATNELDRLAATARATRAIGRSPGLGVNAGHDLSLDNLPTFLARVGRVDEVSIGHAITAEALLVGFADAVRRYKAALEAAAR